MVFFLLIWFFFVKKKITLYINHVFFFNNMIFCVRRVSMDDSLLRLTTTPLPRITKRVITPISEYAKTKQKNVVSSSSVKNKKQHSLQKPNLKQPLKRHRRTLLEKEHKMLKDKLEDEFNENKRLMQTLFKRLDPLLEPPQPSLLHITIYEHISSLYNNPERLTCESVKQLLVPWTLVENSIIATTVFNGNLHFGVVGICFGSANQDEQKMLAWLQKTVCEKTVQYIYFSDANSEDLYQSGRKLKKKVQDGTLLPTHFLTVRMYS